MAFGVSSGKFLDFLVSNRDIEVNSAQIKAIKEIPDMLTSKKEVQRLTGRIAALGRFISKSSEKYFKFFSALKKQDQFEWSEECQQALKNLKVYLSNPSLLAKPKDGERLLIYPAVLEVAVSAVLVREDQVLDHDKNEWGMDIVGLLPQAKGKVKFLLVLTDYFTKWVEAGAFKQIKRITSMSYHPVGNGQAESMNKVIVNNLKKRLEESKGNWPELLPGVLWAYHTTTKISTGETPFSLVYGAETLISIEIGEPSTRKRSIRAGNNRWQDITFTLECHSSEEILFLRKISIHGQMIGKKLAHTK
ncbi:uncharacterized protein LOC142170627 [Nicotiana tabacum]|uniref:Uncharacterized protein LOC142170627 n=1 Tax=Nicotiana tabacum TaxID=4097 RepID=A0AC58SUI5_TOBAC